MSWRYWDDGNLGVAWSSNTYDDSGWATGSAEFGYGDGDESTVISYGPSGSNKWVTSYFRTTFSIADMPDQVTVKLVADDGAVVYLNGVEALRDNMPEGAIDGSTLASSGRWGDAESDARAFTIDPALLVSGENYITVEVHQDRPSSSDLSMDLDVIGTTTP